MFEVGCLVEVGDLDVGGLRRVRALLLDQLAQLRPPQQLLRGGTAKEIAGLKCFSFTSTQVMSAMVRRYPKADNRERGNCYLNVITTLVMGQPMTKETEPSRVTSETSETHVDSQMSDSGICNEMRIVQEPQKP